MGWLYKTSLDGHSGPRAYLDAQFTYERAERHVRVLRSALVQLRTWYAAVEIVDRDGTREVIAAICLVRYDPRDRDGYIFGYKDMDEGIGPCEAECPAAILDLLTPTERPYASERRSRCRANLARRSARPRLRDGDTLIFAQPLHFADGSRHDRLTLVVDPRWPRRLRFRAPGSAGLYRVARLHDQDFQVHHLTEAELDAARAASRA